MNHTDERFDNKDSAIIRAHLVSRVTQMPAYAIETKFDWMVSQRKPSLRFGKVIECENGHENLA